MGRLEEKACIVTGAASGIGRTTSALFAAEGAEVLAFDVDAHGLDTLSATQSGITSSVVDITQPAEVRRVIAQIGKIDVLFNCAGCVTVGSALECSDDDWARTLDLNVSAIFQLSRAVLPRMQAAGGGSIINMASVISSIGGAPDRFAYGMSKAAVIGMTKSLARDFADQKIRCNAICASAIETPSMRDRIQAMPDPARAREEFEKRQPVGRMGSPEEIASLAVYLASDESQFVTGSAIVIDGGAKL